MGRLIKAFAHARPKVELHYADRAESQSSGFGYARSSLYYLKDLSSINASLP